MTEQLSPEEQPPHAVVDGWTAEQWKANAVYWHKQAQEAYRQRDIAAARDEALVAQAARVEAAMIEVARELNEWNGDANPGLGGLAPGGLVYHALNEALLDTEEEP